MGLLDDMPLKGSAGQPRPYCVICLGAFPGVRTAQGSHGTLQGWLEWHSETSALEDGLEYVVRGELSAGVEGAPEFFPTQWPLLLGVDVFFFFQPLSLSTTI